MAIRVPIVSGKPYVPKDGRKNMMECDLTVDYYVEEPKDSGFLSIHPEPQTSCIRQQYFLGGACDSQIIQFNKDRPNLIILPNTNTRFYPVEGRSEVMVSADISGYMAANSNTLFRMSHPGTFRFPGGASVHYYGSTMLTEDDESIFMTGPSINIDANSTRLSLPQGGWRENMVIGIQQEFPDNTNMNTPYGLPHMVTTTDGISEFQSTMEYPTLNDSYIRLPVVPPTQ